MRDAVIMSGARTPVGRFGGGLKDVAAPDLGAAAIKAALQRAGVGPESVEEVLMGNALQATEYGYAALMSSLSAGIPEDVPVIAINRQCGSGLEAINLAATLVRAGEVDVAVAGGVESMSQLPFVLDYRSRFDGLRMGDATLKDGLTNGLACPVNSYHMGVTAENVAERFGVSREDQDELAVISHQRATDAIKNGRFDDQIVEVSVPQRRGDPVIVNVDEGPREDTSLDRLASLRPLFKKDGTVTAGNASSINDAAAAVVVMSGEKASELGLKPALRWHARSVAGVDPAVMGIGPVPAVQKLMSKTGMTVQDMDLIELNEAFASQAIHCIRELDMDMDVTNVNGSGISLGHPVGATGGIMTVKLMAELARQDKQFGLATLCIGGGQGVATIFERIG